MRHPNVRKAFQAASLALATLLATVLSSCAQGPAVDLGQVAIMVVDKDGAEAELDGSTLTGAVTIYPAPLPAGIKVHFYVDAEPESGAPALSAASENARLELDTRALESGNHVLVVRFTDARKGLDKRARVRFRVENDEPVENQPPRVEAGSDTRAVVGEAVVLSATVSDDGVPAGNVGVLWRLVEGPGTVVFADPHALETTVTFAAAGNHVIEVVASDGALQATDRLTVIVEKPPAWGPEEPEPGDPGPGEPAPGEPLPEGPSPDYAHLAQVFVSPTGDDRNPGTADKPLRTVNEGLKRALDNRKRGAGTRVLLMPGVYRESLAGGYSSTPGPLIVIESYHRHQAVMSGADLWDDWGCSNGICSSHWPYDWGSAANPWPGAIQIGELALRREIVSVNGVNLEQVLSRSDLVAGSFYVDEPGDRLYVAAPAGVELSSARVEVGVRPVILRTQGLSNVVIEGIVFTHAATPFRGAAVDIVDQSDVTLSNARVELNGQNGVSLKGQRLRVVDTVIDSSGSSGITAYKTTDSEIANVTIRNGNWRGVRGGYDSWEVGNKFTLVHRMTITDLVSTDNRSRGLWLDSDNADVTIERATLSRNLRDGIFIEANQGPIRLADSTIHDNQEYGILTSASKNLEIVGNDIGGNVKSQLRLSGSHGHSLTDFETGVTHALENEYWTVTGNSISSRSGGPLITTTYPTTAWSRLMSTSRFDRNDYSSGQTRPFQVSGGSMVDFAGWKERTGQDRNSTFSP